MPIYFITGNKHKFKEASTIIPGLKQLNIDLVEIQELDPKKIIKAKLNEARALKPGAEFIVEDVCFSLSALKGLPGPFIKWFLETLGPDGIADIAFKFSKFKAEASAIIGYSNKLGQIKYFQGRVPGAIVRPRGRSGFGFDVIFVPNGHKQTYAEMPEKTKNKISHRALALDELKKYIQL